MLDHVPLPTYWNEDKKMDIPEKQPETKKPEPSESEKAKADYDRWCENVTKLEFDLERARETRKIKKRHWEALQKLEDDELKK